MSLTASEQEFYLQVKEILVGAQFKFSRGLLKRFVHWGFKYFPDSKLNYVFLDGILG